MEQKFIVEIAPGWGVDDLHTENDIALALSIVDRDISAIEAQLAEAARAHETGRTPDQFWQRRAKGALRTKRLLRTQVEVAGAKLANQTSRDKLIAEILAQCEPAAS